MAQIHQTSIKLQILRGRLLLKLRTTTTTKNQTRVKPSCFPPAQSRIRRPIMHGEMILLKTEREAIFVISMSFLNFY